MKHIIEFDRISATRTDDTSIKLCDFGLSVFATGQPMSEIAGSIMYMAPEMLAQRYEEPVSTQPLAGSI